MRYIEQIVEGQSVRRIFIRSFSVVEYNLRKTNEQFSRRRFCVSKTLLICDYIRVIVAVMKQVVIRVWRLMAVERSKRARCRCLGRYSE